MGNPVVLSNDDYDIYADGKNSFLMAYPVGSIFWSNDSTSPQTKFGGTWQQITNVFLFAYNGTDSGKYTAISGQGEITHRLTLAEIPIHSHNQHTYGGCQVNIAGGVVPGYNVGSSEDVGRYDTDAVGGDGAHNNMPPYLKRYCWQRTA